MQQEISLQGTTIQYTLRKSKRTRWLRLAVHRDGRVVVTTPLYGTQRMAQRFIRQKSTWLAVTLDLFRQQTPLRRYSRAHYLQHREAARKFVAGRIAHYKKTYSAAHNRISIKNQKTCWGSCSRKHNLNFNYKILLLPPQLADYIIVHELCHLQEMNHSRKFWELVSRTFPDHPALRKSLRHHSLMLH